MPDKKNMQTKLNQRHTRPQTLASAFGGLMNMFGTRASDADLANRWGEIMGDDIASIAKLVGIRKAKDNKLNISIKATSPALTLQLSYQTDEIKKRINKYFGYYAAGRITIRK